MRRRAVCRLRRPRTRSCLVTCWASTQPTTKCTSSRFPSPLAAHYLNDASCCASVWFETSRLACRANWTAKEGAQLIENLYLGKVLGAGMQIRPPVASCLLSTSSQWMQLHRYKRCICMCVHGMHVDSCASMAEAVCGSHTNACKLDAEAVPLAKAVPLAAQHGQIYELKDGAGRIAPIVLKVLKSGALIGDIEREWEAGQRVSQLADENGNLPVSGRIEEEGRSVECFASCERLQRDDARKPSQKHTNKCTRHQGGPMAVPSRQLPADSDGAGHPGFCAILSRVGKLLEIYHLEILWKIWPRAASSAISVAVCHGEHICAAASHR